MSLPRHVPRKNHGRNPTEGFDCAGLPIWMYAQAGIDISDVDVPYTQASAKRLNAAGMMEQRLSRLFDNVTDLVRSGDDRDGDIWLFNCGNRLRHIGVFVDGLVYHVAEDLIKKDAYRVRPIVLAAFRLRLS